MLIPLIAIIILNKKYKKLSTIKEKAIFAIAGILIAWNTYSLFIQTNILLKLLVNLFISINNGKIGVLLLGISIGLITSFMTAPLIPILNEVIRKLIFYLDKEIKRKTGL